MSIHTLPVFFFVPHRNQSSSPIWNRTDCDKWARDKQYHLRSDIRICASAILERRMPFCGQRYIILYACTFGVFFFVHFGFFSRLCVSRRSLIRSLRSGFNNDTFSLFFRPMDRTRKSSDVLNVFFYVIYSIYHKIYE